MKPASSLLVRTFLLVLALLPASASANPPAITGTDVATAKQILKDSIAIPTVEGRGRVPELAAYYAEVLRKAGFSDEDIVITPMGETATLEVTLRGREPSQPPILLSGHMDVVEADPADWERDPFTAIEEDGYIFGRGSYDNKFGVAMLVTTLARLKREGFRPRQDMVMALSGDEETGMATTKVLAEKYRGAALMLNSDAGGGSQREDGSPQYYLMQAAEKTYVDLEIEFTNPGGHSSRPSKPNAITQLADALVKIDAYDFPPQLSPLTSASLLGMAEQVEPRLGNAMRRLVDDPEDSEALEILRGDPEYIGQIGTTCVATMIHGGHAKNALPQRATANINCRVFPGVTLEALKSELLTVIDNPAARLSIINDPSMSPASPLREDVMDAVEEAVHAVHADLPIIPSMSAYGTDGTHFRAAGTPSYGTAGLFIKPSDDFTHGLNERIPVASIGDALVHWDLLLRRMGE